MDSNLVDKTLKGFYLLFKDLLAVPLSFIKWSAFVALGSLLVALLVALAPLFLVGYIFTVFFDLFKKPDLKPKKEDKYSAFPDFLKSGFSAMLKRQEN